MAHLTSSFAGLLDTNDLAVEAIVNGDNLTAFRLIEDATKKCAAVAPSLLSERPHRLTATDPCHGSCYHARVTVKPYFHCAFHILATDEGSDNFCPSPFVLTVNGNEGSDPSMAVSQFNVAVAVALYNMALACHIQYKVTQCMEKARILSDRARILYQKAAKLLHGNLNREQIEIFLAICINACGEAQDQGNLVQIRFWLHKFDQAVLGFQNLSSLTPYLLQREVFYMGQFSAARAA